MLLSFVSESYYRLLVCNLSVCVQTRLTMRYTANKQTNWNFFSIVSLQQLDWFVNCGEL